MQRRNFIKSAGASIGGLGLFGSSGAASAASAPVDILIHPHKNSDTEEAENVYFALRDFLYQLWEEQKISFSDVDLAYSDKPLTEYDVSGYDWDVGSQDPLQGELREFARDQGMEENVQVVVSDSFSLGAGKFGFWESEYDNGPGTALIATDGANELKYTNSVIQEVGHVIIHPVCCPSSYSEFGGKSGHEIHHELGQITSRSDPDFNSDGLATPMVTYYEDGDQAESGGCYSSQYWQGGWTRTLTSCTLNAIGESMNHWREHGAYTSEEPDCS